VLLVGRGFAPKSGIEKKRRRRRMGIGKGNSVSELCLPLSAGGCGGEGVRTEKERE
jgi:hypothetical protein